jgi:TRAP-type C4-dicarboxylate transport system substrate-binding protein
MSASHPASLARALPFALAAMAASAGLGITAPRMAYAVDWDFYHHQSAPQFATSRGARMLAAELEKATNGELKARLHLSGTLQISATTNITSAVASNVVQMVDDLFNSGSIPVAGIPRLPMLIQNYDEMDKVAGVLRPYVSAAFAEKGVTMLADYVYPLQVIWGRKPIAGLDALKGVKLRVSQPEQGELLRLSAAPR